MSHDVFRKLRDHLNRLPIGTPETSSEVEREILRELFTPEQAEMTLNLTAVPESVEEIAGRTGKPQEEIASCIQEMEKQGLIWWTEETGEKKFSIMPLYPGILELQVDRMGEKLAGLTERYLDSASPRKLWGQKKLPFSGLFRYKRKFPWTCTSIPMKKSQAS